jgi:hypothetical protein
MRGASHFVQLVIHASQLASVLSMLSMRGGLYFQ